jgi:serine/threonine-protein kinase
MSTDPSITELLRRYEDLLTAGQPATPEEVCRDCPQLVDQFKKHLEVLALLDSVPRDEDGENVTVVASGGGPVAPPAAAEAGPRYRALRFHAKGGLGEVHVAEDSELHRRVALKRIQDCHAESALLRQRFLREAELTARLEHPGVVPVHGLVQDAGGQPSYAMRFIEGESLQDAIQHFHAADRQPGRDAGERRLALRELLGRFLAVCNTIAFAHDRGIVHRDLKPANVMLGRYGETFVVDWGLARYLGETEREKGQREEAGASTPPLFPTLTFPAGEALTAPGQVAGTPAYMSPEQAGGRWDEVGRASDVYSLGVMLYEVLAGQPPFPGPNPAEVLGRVQRGDFKRPRQVRPAVPRVLEAVCLKAMALRPADRYATALELKTEVEHWLADEPVLAYHEPVPVRLGRWARRHKPAVAAVAGAVLVALLVGGAGLVWAQRQAEKRERAVEVALAKAADLQRQARWAEAGAVLEQAESRLGEGGPEDLRRRLARARRDLDLVARLEAIRLKQGTLVVGDARMHLDYAAVFKEAGLGTVGEDPAVVAARVRASAVRAELVAALDDWASSRRGPLQTWVLAVARGADPDPWRDRVRDPRVWNSKRRLARLVREAHAGEAPPRFVAFLGVHLHALLGGDSEALLRAAQERRPGDFWVNYSLAHTLSQKRAGEALGYYRAALAVRPDSPFVLNDLGNALLVQGKVAEAVRAYRRALALAPKLPQIHTCLGVALVAQGKVAAGVKAHRRAIALDAKFAPAHNNLGLALKAQGNLASAVRAYRCAIDLDPKEAKAHYNLGVALKAQGKLAGAVREYRRAIALDFKDVTAYSNLGRALLKQGKAAAAVRAYRRALDIAPKDATALTNLGVALSAQGKFAAAVKAHRQAIDIKPKLVHAHYNLSQALLKQGKVAAAVRACRRAIALDPKDAKAHTNLGVCLQVQRKLVEAVKEYRRAIALDSKYALAYSNLGVALSDQGKVGAAVRALRRAVTLDPKFAQAYTNLGNALTEQGKRAEAVKAYRRAIALDPKLAQSHGALGRALLKLGQFAKARRATRRCLRLLPDADPLRPFVTQQLRQCQQLLALDRKLTAVLQGEGKPDGPAEQLSLAGLCLRYKKRYAAAARFYAGAFAAQPKLAADFQAGHRYNAGCAAARAGCGQGEDGPKLSADERARWRKQAVDWLRADLALWAKHLEKNTPKAKEEVLRGLRHWQRDPALAGLRDRAGLAQLPAEERDDCRKLWAEVAALWKRASPK